VSLEHADIFYRIKSTFFRKIKLCRLIYLFTCCGGICHLHLQGGQIIRLGKEYVHVGNIGEERRCRNRKEMNFKGNKQFLRGIDQESDALKTEAETFSQLLVYTYQTTRCDVPGDSSLHTTCRENLTLHTSTIIKICLSRTKSIYFA
jgi:hypothetical protein